MHVRVWFTRLKLSSAAARKIIFLVPTKTGTAMAVPAIVAATAL